MNKENQSFSETFFHHKLNTLGEVSLTNTQKLLFCCCTGKSAFAIPYENSIKLLSSSTFLCCFFIQSDSFTSETSHKNKFSLKGPKQSFIVLVN